MAKNKMSIWAIIILVSTIISLLLLVATVTFTAIAIPGSLEATKQAAIAEGLPEAEVKMAVTIALGAIIAALAISAIFDILKVIGGFMFSLKGKWGIFCIVISILSLIGAIYTIITDIKNKAGVISIVVSSLTVAVNVLMVVACFKHRAEVQ